MKTFIISTITFFVIIFLIIIYILFLNSSINEIYLEIDNILNETNQNGKAKEESIIKLEEKWISKRKSFEAFMHHSKTEEIGLIIKEIKLYNESGNKNQVIIKSEELKMLLGFIADDEIPTIENII